MLGSGANGKKPIKEVEKLRARKAKLEHVSRDITEKKKAEKELSSALAWQEAVFEGARDAVFISDADSRFVMVNRAACELTGFPKGELLGMRIPDLHEQEDLTAYNIYHDRIMAGEEIVSEARILRKDGTKVDAEFNNRCIKISGTEYMHTVARDITERKKAQEKIKLFSHAIAGAIDAIGITDMKGIFTYTNPAMEEIFGYKKGELIGKHVSALNLKPETAEEMLSTLIKTGSWNGEVLQQKKNKETFPALLSLSTIRDEKRNPIATMGAVRDITERKRAEEALHESEQELKIRNRINNIFLTIPDEKMYAEVLNLVLEVMESKFGTFGYFKENGAFAVPAMTREIFWDKCNVPEKDIIFERGTFSGIWGMSIKEKRTLFSNQGPFNTPKGHVPIKNTMVTPIIFRDEVISAIHIANKANDYDETDQVMLETLARHIAPVLYARLQADKQDKERKRAEEALRLSKQDWEKTFNALSDWVVLMDLKGRILRTNPIGEEFVGVPVAEIAGQTCCKLVHGSDTPLPGCPLLKMLQSGRSEAMELQIPNSNRWLAITADPVRDENGTIVGAVHITRDITGRKLFETEQEITIELLHLLNATNQKHELMELVTKYLKDWSGCEAIGIRLAEGEDFPYYVTSGFPEEFILAETRLCAVNELGEIERDSQGRPYLECMCGNVISGRFDPTKPFFTEHGSFWTNSTTELLAGTTEADRMARTRNRCNTAGYESVALIPLRAGRETFGLLQFNDKHKGRFTPEKISMFERLADSLALGLAQCRAEEALRESEQKYRALVEQSLQGIIILQDFQIIFANPTAAKIAGLTVDEVMALSPEDIKAFIPAEERAAILQRYEERLADKLVEHNYELRLVRKNGDGFWLDVFVSQIEYLGKSAIQVAFIDITERKRAEEALRQSEENFRSIFDNANDIIASVTKTGRILEVNKKIEDILGYKPDELIGKNFMTLGLLAAKNAARMFHIFKEAVKIGGFLVSRDGRNVTEVWVNHKDGHTVLLEANTTTIKKDGKLVGYLSVIRDITERKKAEEALRESQENYRMVTELTSDYIVKIKVEPNGQVVLVSATDRLKEITGYAIDELRSSSSWSKIVHPDDLDKFQDFWKRILSSRKSCELEFRGIDRKQKFEWLHAYGQPVLDEKNDRVISIVFAVKVITERKLAEEAYRSLVDHSLQGLAIFQNGRVVFANQAMVDITGYTVKEMLTWPPKQVQAFVHPDDRELVWSRHRARLNGEELPERYEFRGIRRDGSTCWLELHASRIEYQGKPAIQVAYVDITERMKAEEELQKSERQASAAIEAARGFTFNYNIATGKINWGGAIEEITGYTPKEFSQVDVDGWVERIHPDDRDKILSILQEAIQVKDRATAEYRFRTKKGDYVILSSISLTEKKDGKAVRLVGILQDITERKKAEEELRKSEEHYRMLAETMNDGLGVIDEKGTYVYANNKIGEILGHSPDEIVGRHWKDFFDEDAQKIINEQLTVRKKGIAEPYELINTRKDGQKIFIRISPQAIFDEDGKFKGSIKIMTDITERKKAEEQIAKLAKFPAENPNPVLRISGRGTVIYANKAGVNLLKTWDCRVGKSVTDRWNELVMDSLSSGQNQQTEVQCDGRTFSLTFAPVVDANYVNVYGHDITKRKKAEEEIVNLAKFPEENTNPVYRISKDGVLLYANSASRRLIFEDITEIGNKIPEKWLGMIKNVYDSGKRQQVEVELSGRVFLFEQVPVIEGGYVNSYATDITERKKAEEKLLEDQAKLKAMASEMLLTEERERQRLAVGLHDEVCQKLVLTKLALESSLQLVSDSNVLASLRIVCEGIGETIEQADSLTFELSNPVLHQLGFVIALEKYLTEEIQQKYGIEYELEGDEQLSTLPDEIKNCLFRVTRELLTNVVKHAHARKVKVSARESQSQIYVRVQDDGVGFKESQAGSTVSQTARFGLFSIREQLEYLGGHLEIESEPGQGTTATVVVPLRDKATV